MKVEIDARRKRMGGTCTVTREKSDPVFRDSGWGSGESRLLYHVKKILNARGFDLIKKRMCKDGHLVDSDQLYLRTRSSKSPKPHVYIYNMGWAIEGADVIFKHDGVVKLGVIYDVFESKTPNKHTSP